MANIIIAGDAVVLTSSLKLSDLEEIKKYEPSALVKMGGEDGKEPIFAIDVVKGAGSVGPFGVSFGRTTNDGTGCACVTMPAPAVAGGIDAIKDAVADQLGAAFGYLTEAEAALPGVLSDIRGKKAAMVERITVQA